MKWRLAWLIFAGIILGTHAQAADKQKISPSFDEAKNSRLLDRLLTAYPDFLRSHNGKTLIWKDGTSMLFDDGRAAKPFDQLLNAPDLQDQFYASYKRGKNGLAPAKNIDPGRVRFQPFFTKMYGDCQKKQVAQNLKTIIWLPRHGGRKVRVTTINNVAANLQKISVELDKLLDKQPGMKKYLSPMSGTYNCRKIAGTDRYSVHAYGAAVDINVKQAHYWRWSKPGKSGLYPWRNKIPLEIVEIFERHGFIWGGKWYHYDTMHFEYRPELLTAASSKKRKKQK
jgi:D-alanyl-D-alanine carboxypeptidase